MKRSKKIFGLLVILFVILLAYASYDIGSRTTFPGARPQLKERLKKQILPSDSLSGDSIENEKEQ